MTTYDGNTTLPKQRSYGGGEYVDNASGDTFDDGVLGDGYFVTPAVFTDCGDEAEVIGRANRTHFGLSGAVFTRDFNRAHRVSNRLRAIEHYTQVKTVYANMGSVPATY